MRAAKSGLVDGSLTGKELQGECGMDAYLIHLMSYHLVFRARQRGPCEVRSLFAAERNR